MRNKNTKMMWVLVCAMACVGVMRSEEVRSEVKLNGPLGERLNAMIERHIAGRDIDYITACFQSKCERQNRWQTEFWGKYMHAAVPFAKYARANGLKCASALEAKINRGLDRVLSSQEEGGYIGNYPDDLRLGEGWDVWGIKYTLMGLMYGAEMGRTNECLHAAMRLCDYVAAEIGPNGKRARALWQTGNWSGYASSSILEPVMWLYNRTHEKRYLDFAAYIVEGMTIPPEGPRLKDLSEKGISVADRNGYGREKDPKKGWQYVCKYGRCKAYEMMSCYQGLLEYAFVTGRQDLREAALWAAEDIRHTEVNLAGGAASAEAWFHGKEKQHLPYAHLQETCVTTTWMRLCEKLLEVTGEGKWADEIEKSFYNAYLGALKKDGADFAAYTPLSGYRWRGMNHCDMHTDCCTANGPRGFLCFMRRLFHVEGNIPTFDFYASATVKGQLEKGEKVAFEMYTTYPRQNVVRIVVLEDMREGTIRFRMPRDEVKDGKWQVKVDGNVVKGDVAKGYVAITRMWKKGESIAITFEMPVKAHVQNNHVAFTRGPILLARDSRFRDGDLAEAFRLHAFREGEKVAAFQPICVPSEDMWMAFSATLPIGSHTENPEAQNPSTVFFCDFSSAGNLRRRDNYYRTWFPEEYYPAER